MYDSTIQITQMQNDIAVLRDRVHALAQWPRETGVTLLLLTLADAVQGIAALEASALLRAIPTEPDSDARADMRMEATRLHHLVARVSNLADGLE